MNCTPKSLFCSSADGDCTSRRVRVRVTLCFSIGPAHVGGTKKRKPYNKIIVLSTIVFDQSSKNRAQGGPYTRWLPLSCTSRTNKFHIRSTSVGGRWLGLVNLAARRHWQPASHTTGYTIICACVLWCHTCATVLPMWSPGYRMILWRRTYTNQWLVAEPYGVLSCLDEMWSRGTRISQSITKTNGFTEEAAVKTWGWGSFAEHDISQDKSQFTVCSMLYFTLDLQYGLNCSR